MSGVTPGAKGAARSRLATGLWVLGNRRRWRRFRRALTDPGEVQRRLLRGYLEQGAETAYGRRHRFSEIDSVEAWRRRVPLQSYDEMEPWIERVRAGEVTPDELRTSGAQITRSPSSLLRTAGGGVNEKDRTFVGPFLFR